VAGARRRPVRRPTNDIPKYVASRTLAPDDLTWANSSLLPRGGAIGELAERHGRSIRVMGSPSLARQLIEHDLVDEYRLMIEPILLRIVPEDRRARQLELVSATGVLICAYRPAGR
jgi:dihydrofolate reductase